MPINPQLRRPDRLTARSAVAGITRIANIARFASVARTTVFVAAFCVAIPTGCSGQRPERPATDISATDISAVARSESGVNDHSDSTRVVDIPAGAVLAFVESVVDGDTITVSLDPEGDFHDAVQTIRLLGIDTPEKPGGPRPAECHGTQATAFTQELLPVGTPVLLVADQQTRDQYGRLLAYVFRATDGLFTNHALVANGHATTLFFAPNTAMRGPLTGAAHRAKTAGIGFWASCGGLPYPIADSP